MSAGADKVSINTSAVKNVDFVKEASKKFGSQCIVVAIDAKKVSDNKWEVFTHGGRNKTCLLYTSPSPRDQRGSRMPSSA